MVAVEDSVDDVRREEGQMQALADEPVGDTFALSELTEGLA